MTHPIARAAALGALLGLAAQSPAGAQEIPEGWKIRTDRGDPAPELVAMPPGWHVKTGPAAIFYQPARTAAGEYRLEAETYLFDPGQRREGFGLIFGGSQLDGDEQGYTYFLIRRDGRFLVKARSGTQTSELHGWTEHPAIVTWEGRGDDEATAKNILGVQATGTEVVFSVNGQDVLTLPREGMRVDGVVGLRVNHGLNLHVTRLEVTPKP